jgi:hypothetical protein
MHWAPKPTSVQRSPGAQSASLWHDAPFMPMPAVAHVRMGPQYEPAAHSSLIVHIVPLVEHPHGSHMPDLHWSPARQSPDDPHGFPLLPAAGPPASVMWVTPP